MTQQVWSNALLAQPFYFMRHGQTQLNAERRIGGRLDPPLNDAGRAQALAARAAVGALPYTAVFCSPALRARQTAALAMPDAQIVLLDGLRERDWGALEGRPQAEQCGYLDTPPDGEPWADFMARVLAALQHAQHAARCPFIVAHSGVWRVLNTLETGAPDGPRIENATPVRVAPGVCAALSPRRHTD